jgi:antitoxin (DNA-binding transcriptional repressor) of toxin-antitoxin stability system
VVSVTIKEALARLADLIAEAATHTVVIVHGERAVRLTPVRVPKHRARRFGSAAGRVHVGAAFGEALTEFTEYS